MRSWRFLRSPITASIGKFHFYYGLIRLIDLTSFQTKRINDNYSWLRTGESLTFSPRNKIVLQLSESQSVNRDLKKCLLWTRTNTPPITAQTPENMTKSRSPGSQTVMVSESLKPTTRKWTVDNFLIFRMGQGKRHKDWGCHGHKPTKDRLVRLQEDRGPVQIEQVLDYEVSRQGHQEVQEAGLTRVFQI